MVGFLRSHFIATSSSYKGYLSFWWRTYNKMYLTYLMINAAQFCVDFQSHVRKVLVLLVVFGGNNLGEQHVHRLNTKFNVADTLWTGKYE